MNYNEAPLNCQVRIYTRLGNACIKYNQANMYRFWIWTSSSPLNQGGRGWLTIRDFRERLRDLGLSWRYTKEILNAGKRAENNEDSWWWEVEDGRVWFIGIKKLANRFNIKNDYHVSAEAEVLLDKVTFKALIHDSIFAKETTELVKVTGRKVEYAGGKRISRQAIRKINSLSKPTQIKYEQTVGTIKEPTEEWYDADDIDHLPLHKQARFCGDVDGDGRDELVFQGVNRYSSPNPDGYSRHYRFSSKSQEGVFFRFDASRGSRIYYENREAAYKAVTRMSAGERGIFVKPTRNLTKRKNVMKYIHI